MDGWLDELDNGRMVGGEVWMGGWMVVSLTFVVFFVCVLWMNGWVFLFAFLFRSL